MTFQDFEDKTRFTLANELVLSECVLGGRSSPKVSVYLEHDTLITFEVSEEARKYRATPEPAFVAEVLRCGDWEDLS